MILSNMKSLSKGLHPVLMLLLFFFYHPVIILVCDTWKNKFTKKVFRVLAKVTYSVILNVYDFFGRCYWYRWFHGTVRLYQAPCWWETNYSVYFLKFCVCEHGMPCVLEINSNGGLKRGHVKYWPSTTKKAYLHYHNGYGCQTWQSCDLPWGATTHKIIWPFDHVVLRDHDIN